MDHSKGPRVWLAGRCGRATEAARVVRDDQLRVWFRGADGLFHTGDRHHQSTWEALTARSDLVEQFDVPA